MTELLRAAFVIARRDFSAVILSRTFLLFLIGPLLPVLIGVGAGGMSSKVASEAMRPSVGILLPADEAAALAAARARLAGQLDDQTMPELRRYPATSDPAALLSSKGQRIVATLSGTLEHPVLSGSADDIGGLQGKIGLLVSFARAGKSVTDAHLQTRITRAGSGSLQQSRLLTGRLSQILLFFMVMLLATMVLSNMVEEKTNKVIEVLAAAVPVDAIFLGKLMAMLSMSLVGLAVWGSCAAMAMMLLGGGAALVAPAVGWPLFILLWVVYFSTAYTLLGALFIGIGAQANTVREVQTLSMPITMSQMLIFFFASYGVSRMGEPPEIAAAVVPFSSPFAMVARAAQADALWPHLLAIVWQLLWVAVIIRIGVRLFRRNVLKSGQPKARRRILFGRRASRLQRET